MSSVVPPAPSLDSKAISPQVERSLQPASRRSAWVGVVVGLGVSAVLLYFAFRKVDGAALWQALRQVSLPVLGLAVLSKGVGFWVGGLRTRGLLAPLSSRLSGYDAALAPLLGSTVNNLAPLRAGELLRLHFTARRSGLPHAAVLVALAFERLLDLLALVAVFGLGLLLAGDRAPALPAAVALMGVVGVVALTLLSVRSRGELLHVVWGRVGPWLGQRLERVLATKIEALAAGVDALGSVSRVARAFALTCVLWALAGLGVQVWFWAFDLSLPAHAACIVLGFLSFGTALPSAPGFVGAYHYFVVLALTTVYGMAPTVAGSVALVGHAVATYPWTLIGLPFVLRQRRLLSFARAEHVKSQRVKPEPPAH